MPRRLATAWPGRRHRPLCRRFPGHARSGRRLGIPMPLRSTCAKGARPRPYLTLQYLTRGRYDDASRPLPYPARPGEILHGQRPPRSRSITAAIHPRDLFDLLSAHRLHFDHASQTGIVLHMMSGVGTYGSLGVTAVGNTPQEAATLYAQLQTVLDQEAANRLIY